MHFDCTTTSLSPPVAHRAVPSDDPVAALLIAYERQPSQGVSAPDRSFLDQALLLFEARLHEPKLDAATIYLAQALYSHRGEHETLLALLDAYMADARPPDEEAWARWHSVDILAVLRRCAEMIPAQQHLRQWAEQTFGVASCLWTMNDGTQALCWVTTRQAHEWLAIFEDLMARAEATAHNRLDRFYYLRTAGLVRMKAGQSEAITPLIQQMSALVEEDDLWEYRDTVRGEAAVLHLSLLAATGSTVELRHVAAETSAHLVAYEAHHPLESDDHRRRVRMLYHNTAAVLYRARHYDLAIPMFRRAIALGSVVPHTYLWLAAALWATTHDRAIVLPLLREAALRDVPRTRWAQYRQLPEFRDIADDSAFANATVVVATSISTTVAALGGAGRDMPRAEPTP